MFDFEFSFKIRYSATILYKQCLILRNVFFQQLVRFNILELIPQISNISTISHSYIEQQEKSINIGYQFQESKVWKILYSDF